MAIHEVDGEDFKVRNVCSSQFLMLIYMHIALHPEPIALRKAVSRYQVGVLRRHDIPVLSTRLHGSIFEAADTAGRWVLQQREAELGQ
jgi:hypothetical protein